MTPVKPWYQSKTVWVNALIVLVAALDALRVLPYVPPDWAATALAVGGVLNILLRLTTNTGLTATPQGDPMRAAPAPQAAPPGEAGAPSDLTLAQQLEADFIARGDLPERAPGDQP